MSRSDGNGLDARRRTVLKLLSAAAAAGTLPAVGTGQTDDAEFAVIQDDECVPVTPLSGDDPVEEFYDWREGETGYSSAGTTDLQRDDTSILFLYDGPDGLSLVLVHGHYESAESGGGSVSMTFEGLPEDGEWVVEDDRYEGDSNYDNWDHDGRRSEIDWTWRWGRTDGGAFFGLEGEFEIEVQPAFNDASAFGDEYYEGEVADWQVLSGDLDDPERTSLALDRPILIRTGGCSIDEVGSDRDDDEGTEDDDDDEIEDDGDDETEEDRSGDDDSDEEEEEEETRRLSKHEKKQRKHERKHERKQEKHQKKHERRQRKHEKEEERERDKHEKKQEKHRKREEKHENGRGRGRGKSRDDDEDALGGNVTDLLGEILESEEDD